jgi:hypothetical protein
MWNVELYSRAPAATAAVIFTVRRGGEEGTGGDLSPELSTPRIINLGV